MFKSFRSEKSAELFHHPGLEYWFKERRTLIDFRRGPLGPYADGFAAYLKAKGYSYNWGRKILGMCCHFNAFLIDQGITKCDDLSESLIDSFLDVYCKDLRTTSAFYSPRPNAQALLKQLFVYLIEIKRLTRRDQKRLGSPTVGFSSPTYGCFLPLIWMIFRGKTSLAASIGKKWEAAPT